MKMSNACWLPLVYKVGMPAAGSARLTEVCWPFSRRKSGPDDLKNLASVRVKKINKLISYCDSFNTRYLRYLRMDLNLAVVRS
jgi:hypothetical protein